jgi:hypothetical protein
VDLAAVEFIEDLDNVRNNNQTIPITDLQPDKRVEHNCVVLRGFGMHTESAAVRNVEDRVPVPDQQGADDELVDGMAWRSMRRNGRQRIPMMLRTMITVSRGWVRSYGLRLSSSGVGACDLSLMS